MDTNQLHDEDAGDFLVGKPAIKSYLVSLGWPEETDPYHLKRTGWPIGNTGGDAGKLIASKRRLFRHTQKLATPS